MSQQSYKTLTVYQDAKQLVIKVYQLLKLFPLEEKFALCDQIRRAVMSVPSNIVEGMSRTSNKEKVHFFTYCLWFYVRDGQPIRYIQRPRIYF